MRKEKYKLLTGAFELAVVFFPLLDMQELFVCGLEKLYPTAADIFDGLIALPVLGAVLSFCILISDNAKAALKKWLCSVPFSFMIGLLLAHTNFSARLLNMFHPGYGRLSAGEGFAGMVMLVCFSFAVIIGNLAAVAWSAFMGGKMKKTRAVLQNIVLPAICALILLSVIYLEVTMPSWEAILKSVYG